MSVRSANFTDCTIGLHPVWSTTHDGIESCDEFFASLPPQKAVSMNPHIRKAVERVIGVRDEMHRRNEVIARFQNNIAERTASPAEVN